MDATNHLELLRLRSDFTLLQRHVDNFGRKLATIEAREKAIETPLDEPAIIMSEPAEQIKAPEPVKAPIKPPPLPRYEDAYLAQLTRSLDEQAAAQTKTAEKQDFTPPAVEEPVHTQPPVIEQSEPKVSGNFEMKLATYWFVRVGVVMLLTGLAFFGFYAYQHFISQLGPIGKLSLIYLAGATLLGGGAWCARDKANEKMQGFGNVLFAGGLSAIYFATYAAHHVEYLRVIASPLVDGLLLMAWAIAVVWLADRKKSEVLALFAIGLSYYTSSITNISTFTLGCNLVLTITAVGFLIRNRWVTLSFAGMIGTYVGYCFWRVNYMGGSMSLLPKPELWKAIAFLSGYWVIYSVAGFVNKAEQMVHKTRALFLTLNNFAFFILCVLTFLPRNEGRFWVLCLTFGGLLLVQAWLARKTLPAERAIYNSLLPQALALITLGFLAKFSGVHLGLILAAETITLLIIGYQLEQRIMRAAAYIVGLLAFGNTVLDLPQFDSESMIFASAVGAVFLACGVWTQRRIDAQNENDGEPRLLYWSCLSWLVWLITVWQNIEHFQRPAVLAVLAALFTVSYPILRLKQFSLLSQGYLFIAQLYWLSLRLDHAKVPGWILGTIIGTTVGLAFWWQKQKCMKISEPVSTALLAMLGIMTTALSLGWVGFEFTLAPRILWTTLLAFGVTLYAVLTGWRALAYCAQALFILLGIEFLLALENQSIDRLYALIPIAAMLGFSGLALMGRNRSSEDASSLNLIARVHQGAAVLMSLIWIHEYLPSHSWLWVQTLISLLFFGLSLYRNSNALMYLSLCFTTVGMVDYWIIDSVPVVTLPNFVAILALFAQQQLLQRHPHKDGERYETLQTCFMVAGALSLWFYETRWISLYTQGFYITAGWAALAFISLLAGLALHDRRYRWFGLLVLGCAIGRVMFIDVWRLATIYRVLSFMALGVVLIVLGYIYTRYQEQIKKWL